MKRAHQRIDRQRNLEKIENIVNDNNGVTLGEIWEKSGGLAYTTCSYLVNQLLREERIMVGKIKSLKNPDKLINGYLPNP